MNKSLVLIDCPLCQSNKNLKVNNTHEDFHIHKYGNIYEGKKISDWVACEQCGFVYQNPRPSTQALNDFYLNSQYHESIPFTPEKYKEFALWYYGEKVQYIIEQTGLKKGKVFDVGFGLGGALYAFEQAGWEVYGVEADKSQYDFVKTNFGFKNVINDILTSKISDDIKVDVVFSNHVFEHIADLTDVVKGLDRILKPGGYIFTAVPTYYKNKSRLSKLWMNSSHYNLFTHKTLNILFNPLGMKEKTHTYQGFWKEVDEVWHLTQRTMEKGEASSYYESGKKVQFYVNYINPLRSLIYWPIFSNWPNKVQKSLSIKRNLKLLFQNPRAVFKKVLSRISA